MSVDYNAFYGRYVTKKEKAVPLHIAKEIEKELCEESTKCRIALGNIERANKELDNLNVPRKQKNSPFPLSLAGRIRTIKTANQLTDTERLNFLQEQLGSYSGKVICRNSTNGKGWRLHETTQNGAVTSVREAIDNYIKQVKGKTNDRTRPEWN